MYSNIIDPKTNKSVSIRSKKGKRVLRKYLTQVIMSGGAALGSDEKDLRRVKFRNKWSHPAYIAPNGSGDHRKKTSGVGHNARFPRTMGKFQTDLEVQLAIKEHDTRLYKKLIAHVRTEVTQSLRLSILNFWKGLLTEAYFKILTMFEKNKKPIADFMELLDFMWVRSMYKMWLGGSIDFVDFHRTLFNGILDDANLIKFIDVSGAGVPCPTLYQSKHHKACHNTVDWSKISTYNVDPFKKQNLKDHVKKTVGDFIPNIRCACTTIDHFMKAFETHSPNIVNPLVKIFDHLTRDRAIHIDVSGHAYYEDLCMDFSQESIPGLKVGRHRHSRGTPPMLAVLPQQAIRQDSSDGDWELTPTTVNTTVEYATELAAVDHTRPLCVRPGESDAEKKNRDKLGLPVPEEDIMMEEQSLQEQASRDWFEKSFATVAAEQARLSPPGTLELKQFNNGATIFTNALRSKNVSVRPLTFGTFSAGISGHTNELSMFVRLFMTDNATKPQDMTPLIALSGLIWMIEYNHHSFREIFLGSMCLAPIKGDWGLPKVQPEPVTETTNMVLAPKLHGLPNDTVYPPKIDYVSMLYKIISPKDIDKFPDNWGADTLGSARLADVSSSVEAVKWRPMRPLRWADNYHWSKYADNAKIHQDLLEHTITDTKQILKNCSPGINSIFDKLVLNKPLSATEGVEVKEVVKRSLNAAAAINLLQRNGYDFSLDFSDGDGLTLKNNLGSGLAVFDQNVHDAWGESAFMKEATAKTMFISDMSRNSFDLAPDNLNTLCGNLLDKPTCLDASYDVPIKQESFWKGIASPGPAAGVSVKEPMPLCNWSTDAKRGFPNRGAYENVCIPRPLSSKKMSGFEESRRSRWKSGD